MPIDETFAKELEAAVEQSVAEKSEVKDDDSGDKVAADVGTEAGDGKAGASRDAITDGDGAVTTEEGGSGSGDGKADVVDAGAGKPAEIVTPAISDTVLTAAVQHGIPLEDAKLFPSEAALNRAIGAVRKSIEQFAPKEEKKTEADEDLLAKLPTLDKEQYEPEVVAMFDAVVGIVKKQQEQLKEIRQQTEQYNAKMADSAYAQTQREITDWFDSSVAKLGDDLKDVLGVGGTDALPPASPQRVKREAIANQAAVMLAGYNAIGKTDVNRDEVFQAAAKVVLADEYAKAAEKKLTESLQKRSKQHIQRAGGNQKAKVNGDPAEAAAEELRKLFPQLSH